ncbi:MAG: alkaline phosphatase [Rhodobacteraceae bacterium PARR1]|nr:MAG: alkaline phosphatase [Rhodobacteraceae bacterium PARR1]
MSLDDAALEKLEAAAFRRLRDHLRARPDVQNIDMMNLAGFCRNCLGRWMHEAAVEQGVDLDKEAARTLFYGMPYDQWKALHQTEAGADQTAKFAEAIKAHEP